MDWKNLTQYQILNGKNDSGERLILAFSRDFQQKMGYELNISCSKCFEEDLRKFLNPENMSKQSKWELKAMYDGIQLGFGSKTILSKSNITDELAEKFANEHPAGLDLFSKYPEDFKPSEKKSQSSGDEKSERQKELEAMKRPELNALFGEGAEKISKKPDLIQEILKREAEGGSGEGGSGEGGSGEDDLS